MATLVHSVFSADGREVITLAGFTALVGRPQNTLEYYKRVVGNMPERVATSGRNQYYYLEDLVEWYQSILTEKQIKVDSMVEAFAKVKQNAHLVRETNKASRQALLDSLKSKKN